MSARMFDPHAELQAVVSWVSSLHADQDKAIVYLNFLSGLGPSQYVQG